MEIKETDQCYVANTYARYPVEIVRGKGSMLYDEAGKSYIDLGTGIAVNTLGVADEGWIKAVTAQLDAFQHTSNLYYAAPVAQLAEELCHRTGMKKVFFSNSGAEANECAIKVARKYGENHYGPERTTIITLKNSFHGRTLATLAATGQDVFHQHFLPVTPGFRYAEANQLADVKALAADGKVAGILLEMVQGEGGVMPLEKDFVQGVAEFCQQEDILLMCDEIQCGNGRSGKLYAYMHYGITPDVVSTAKGLAGGLPLGATMLGEKVENTLHPGDHGSTFGGNPVCCAGGLYILSQLNEELLQGVTRKSAYMVQELSQAKGIKAVTGLGLMLGLETVASAKTVIEQCMARGVLPIQAKAKVRLLPALNIPDDLLAEAVGIIKEVCAEAEYES